MAELNPLLKNLFFSQLKRGIVKAVKEKNKETDFGKVLSIDFVISNSETERSFQKVKFEKFEDSIDMDESDKKDLCKITMQDYNKIKTEYNHVFIKMDFELKKIYIRNELKNKTTENFIL